MIIAISGKKNSGKDLSGKIIQYLISGKNVSEINELILNNKTEIFPPKSDFKIKKFADKLKDIICLLTGCTKEQLENRDFKNNELGIEWWKWQAYKMGGKEYFATEKEAITHNDKMYRGTGNITCIKTTYRYLLQNIGTNLFRNQLHSNVWVNSLMSEYVPISDKLLEGEIRKVREEDLIYPNWIITDLRFKNELKAIKEKKGITIRINREKQCRSCENIFTSPGDCTKCNSGNWIFGNIDEHESETNLDNSIFDYTIINEGSIKDLIIKIKNILIKENII